MVADGPVMVQCAAIRRSTIYLRERMDRLGPRFSAWGNGFKLECGDCAEEQCLKCLSRGEIDSVWR
jgi:hypothetical protein